MRLLVARKGFLLFMTMLLFEKSFTQSDSAQQRYSLNLTHSAEKITLDGELSEPVWQTSQAATNFWEMIFRDQDKAHKQTEFRVAYNNQFLYFAATAYDSLPYEATTRKRDANLGENDGVGFIIDPLNQHSNGFFFWVSPGNVQIEDVVSANNSQNMTFSWDNKWFSATKQYADRWTAEIAIPFTSIRYAADRLVWGIGFYRIDMKGGQYSSWAKIPLNIEWNDLGYLGALRWNTPPPSPGKNISFIPYATGAISSNGETTKAVQGKFNAGLDAKVAVTTSLNLDLTLNPDFSQVDVDQQVTNLTRFDIFFPEKRTFFLENADLYTDIGYPLIQPFYSRTIGLDKAGNIIPILGGARLSGNINKNLRIAVMNMQTRRKEAFAAQNYTAISVKRQVLKRSTLGCYILNREGFMSEAEKQRSPLEQYGRNAGIEARYTSNTTKWKGFAGYNYSFKPQISKKNTFLSSGIEYSVKKVGVKLHFNNVGTNYYADMGFIGRINNYDAHLDTVYRMGFKQLFNQVEYRTIPKKKNIQNILWGLENQVTWNPDGTLNDQLNRLRSFVYFSNRSELQFRVDWQLTKLLYYTKFTDFEPLPPARYSYTQWNVDYVSDYRKKFSYKLSVRQGAFYNGNLLSLASAFNFRFGNWSNLNLYFEYNKLRFPSPYGATQLFLIGPRMEVYFSNNLFWTTFLQYNTQANNFNINSRVQWRYKPMSDVFLVFTDNYFSTPFLKNKNRAIVLKLNYWLNL